MALSAVFLLGLVALTLADKWVFTTMRVGDREAIERKDWYQFLRAIGYLPVWIAIGAAMIAHDVARRAGGPLRRGGLVALGAALGGGAAELLKVVLPRQRPINNGFEDGTYIWGTPFEVFQGVGNHGLASSHVGVAFGGAIVVAMLFPGSGWVAIPLALGCGLTRLLTGAHFATDVYIAAWMASVISVWLAGPGRSSTR